MVESALNSFEMKTSMTQNPSSHAFIHVECVSSVRDCLSALVELPSESTFTVL